MLFLQFACVYLHDGADSIIEVGSYSLSCCCIYKFVTTNTFNCHDTIAYINYPYKREILTLNKSAVTYLPRCTLALLVFSIKYFFPIIFEDENGFDSDSSSTDDGTGATFHPPSTSFCRLNVATNLNPPPSNWLMSGAHGHVPPGVDQLSG